MILRRIKTFAVLDKPSKVDADGLIFRSVQRLGPGTDLCGIVFVNDKICSAVACILMVLLAVYDQHAKRLNRIPGQVDVNCANNIIAQPFCRRRLLAHDLGAPYGRIHVPIGRHNRNVGVGQIDIQNIGFILVGCCFVVDDTVDLSHAGRNRIVLSGYHLIV